MSARAIVIPSGLQFPQGEVGEWELLINGSAGAKPVDILATVESVFVQDDAARLAEQLLLRRKSPHPSPRRKRRSR